jgi:hypothetical protein
MAEQTVGESPVLDLQGLAQMFSSLDRIEVGENDETRFCWAFLLGTSKLRIGPRAAFLKFGCCRADAAKGGCSAKNHTYHDLPSLADHQARSVNKRNIPPNLRRELP